MGSFLGTRSWSVFCLLECFPYRLFFNRIIENSFTINRTIELLKMFYSKNKCIILDNILWCHLYKEINVLVIMSFMQLNPTLKYILQWSISPLIKVFKLLNVSTLIQLHPLHHVPSICSNVVLVGLCKYLNNCSTSFVDNSSNQLLIRIDVLRETEAAICTMGDG